MEWATLADLIKALAWPVVVLILGLKAKPILQGVLDRVKRIKAGGIEIDTSDIPKELEAPKGLPPGQKALPPPKENAPPQLETEQSAPAEPDLVDYAPEGAVIQAWARLEETLRREAIRLVGSSSSKRSLYAASLIVELQRAGVIADDRAGQANKLLKIRNEVAHGVGITKSASAQFVVTTESLIRDIEGYADIIQLRRIFNKLNVDYTNLEEVRKIRVVRLRADPESGLGVEWAARTDEAIMPVTERDAALLVARGATLKNPEEVPRP